MDEPPATRSPLRVMESMGDRLGVSPWSVLLGAIAVVAAAAGGWWALAAPDPPAPEEILPRADETAALVAPSTSEALDVLVVHVDGAVLAPGVHEIVIGGRVVDAVDAAGGLTPDADRTRLNLAEPLADGQRVWVPVFGEAEPTVVAPNGGAEDSAGGSGQGAPLDLNTADAAALETLPGIGPTIAAAIVDHREREGRYRSVDGLLDVAGIGPARLAQLESLVAV